MLPIKNKDKLFVSFNQMHPNWQKTVYSHTGVIPIYKNNSIALFSNCGYIDLDRDAEYYHISGKDITEYFEINSVADLIEYILQMESYHEFLVDKTIGQFTKSDLFWAVYSAIINIPINQQHEDGTTYSEWRLHSIHLYQERLELNMAVIDCDLVDICVNYDKNCSLLNTLKLIVNAMNQCTEHIRNIPQQRIFEEHLQNKPITYEELNKKLGPGGEFAWLS